MLLEEITSLLKNKLSPEKYKLDSEIYGIQYGNKNKQKLIKKVLLTLDLSLEAIHFAFKKKYNLILSHHSLFDDPIQTIERELINKLTLLSKNPILVYTLNSSFIAAEGGISDTIMELLYLELDQVFCIKDNNGNQIPIGRICTPKLYLNEKEEYTLENLLKRVKNYLEMKFIKYVGNLRSPIKKICIIGGEIADLYCLKKALQFDCDCVISSNFHYSEATFARDNGLNLIEISHYKSEIITMKKLCNILSLEFPYDEFTLFESKDPFYEYS